MLAELKAHFLQTDMTLEAQERKTSKVMTTLMSAAKKKHNVESLGSCSAELSLMPSPRSRQPWTKCWRSSRPTTSFLQTDMTVEAQERKTNKLVNTVAFVLACWSCAKSAQRLTSGINALQAAIEWKMQGEGLLGSRRHCPDLERRRCS